jgi:hypothetical protein
MIALRCRPGSPDPGATRRLLEDRTFFKMALCFELCGDHRVQVRNCTDSVINRGDLGN